MKRFIHHLTIYAYKLITYKLINALSHVIHRNMDHEWSVRHAKSSLTQAVSRH